MLELPVKEDILGICQLVLMDADTSHRNVGGVFLRKQTINS